MTGIVVVGGGFAGLWAAVGAARKRAGAGIAARDMPITLINRDGWHGIRVRNYEADLTDVRLPLRPLLDTAEVGFVEGATTDIDASARTVVVDGANGRTALPYDRLVLAAGSALPVPPVPGLSEHAYNVDTYGAAERLNRHVEGLVQTRTGPARDTAVVIGAGLTGVEIACELPDRMRAAGIAHPRVVLIDRNSHIGSDMGDQARAVIGAALTELGVETMTGAGVAAVEADGIAFADGETLPAATVVWTAGMRASGLADSLGRPRDALGRIEVDPYMRVDGVDGVFAAGDVAAAMLEPGHASVMSCQHGRPMGRFAGHNVVAEMIGGDMLPLEIPYYVTCLDLGSWGAVYTEGWNREVVASGPEAKRTKETINRRRIYPPTDGDRAALLAAAEPVVQMPPRKLRA